MKRNTHIVIAIVTVCLLAALVGAVKLFRYYLPQEGPGCTLFEQYKGNPYVKACLLRDFRVDDTLAVDVVLLEATTDSAWCELLLDFGASEDLMNMYKTNKEFFISDERNSILLFYVKKSNLKKRLPPGHPDSRLVIASFIKQSICVFMTEENNVKKTIGLSEIIKLKNKKQ